MGNDGGSIPDRRDLVRSKPKAEQADRANQSRARWFFCALSKRPLRAPIASDALGRLYNKDALIEFLLDRAAYGDGEDICGHIRSLKDIKTLNLTPVASTSEDDNDDRPRFLCPLTQKEMTGHVPFVYLVPCGCVFSQAGLKSVSASPPPPSSSSSPDASSSSSSSPDATAALDVCPQCATKFNRVTDVRTINPAPEEEERMFTAMLAARVAKGSKKRKATATASNDKPTDKKARKKAENDEATGAGAKKPNERKPERTAAVPSMASSATGRAVQASLAAEEAKRKAAMSDAVRSLYRDKNTPKRKETFMTMGTFTRYA